MIGRNALIGPGAIVEEAVLLGHCVVDTGARVRRTIVDHGVTKRTGESVRFDEGADRERFHVDPSGIVLTGLGDFADERIIRVR